MPDRIQHAYLTRCSLDLQPGRFQLPAGDRDALIDEYCMFPDQFFTTDPEQYAAILPYMFIDQGIQFHYPPNIPLAELYRYWLPSPEKGCFVKSQPFRNLNFIHVKKGFEFYLERIVCNFREGAWDEGVKYAGCLLHMLEDSCFGAHALEGPFGSDLFILERLFDPLEEDWQNTPLAILAALDCSAIEPGKNAPRLLGQSIPEIVMHLYAAYVETVNRSRRLCFHIVENVRQSKEQQNAGLIRQMSHNTVRLCADTLFSAWSVATNSLDQTDNLREISLTRLEPHVFPLGGAGGYRFLSYLKDFAVNTHMQKIPLQLRFDNAILTYDSGLSWGSHYEAELLYWLPENIFAVFECALGLHPDSTNPSAKVTIQVINGGKTVEELHFEEQNPARNLKIFRPHGDFGFKISYPPGTPQQNLILVAGNPVLKK